MTYGTIKIEKGSGGFGGPLVVTPKPGKDKILYITGGGAEPEIVEKIVEEHVVVEFIRKKEFQQ